MWYRPISLTRTKHSSFSLKYTCDDRAACNLRYGLCSCFTNTCVEYGFQNPLKSEKLCYWMLLYLFTSLVPYMVNPRSYSKNDRDTCGLISLSSQRVFDGVRLLNPWCSQSCLGDKRRASLDKTHTWQNLEQ